MGMGTEGSSFHLTRFALLCSIGLYAAQEGGRECGITIKVMLRAIVVASVICSGSDGGKRYPRTPHAQYISSTYVPTQIFYTQHESSMGRPNFPFVEKDGRNLDT